MGYVPYKYCHCYGGPTSTLEQRIIGLVFLVAGLIFCVACLGSMVWEELQEKYKGYRERRKNTRG